MRTFKEISIEYSLFEAKMKKVKKWKPDEKGNLKKVLVKQCQDSDGKKVPGFKVVGGKKCVKMSPAEIKDKVKISKKINKTKKKNSGKLKSRTEKIRKQKVSKGLISTKVEESTMTGDLGSAPMVKVGSNNPLKRKNPLKKQNIKFKDFLKESKNRLLLLTWYDDDENSIGSLNLYSALSNLQINKIHGNNYNGTLDIIEIDKKQAIEDKYIIWSNDKNKQIKIEEIK